MLDSTYHKKKTRKSLFWRENVKLLQSFTQRYNGRHYVTLLNMYTTSALSILVHGIISLPDATSGDKQVCMTKKCHTFRTKNNRLHREEKTQKADIHTTARTQLK